MNSGPITWTNIVVRLGDLVPWEDNPKTSSDDEADLIVGSFDELGQFATIAIGPDFEVYDGHQRLSALLAKYGPTYEIEARQSSRPLTTEERQKVALYSRQIGRFDWDVLTEWDSEILDVAGFDMSMMDGLREDLSSLGKFLERETTGIDSSLIPDGNRYSEQYGIIIICDDVTQQEEFYNRLTEAGYICRVVVT